eukprot:821081-Prymnesium_polylepis.3
MQTPRSGPEPNHNPTLCGCKPRAPAQSQTSRHTRALSALSLRRPTCLRWLPPRSSSPHAHASYGHA